MTVDGPIDPDDLGTTLIPEHTFSGLVTAWFDRPSSAFEQVIAEEPVSLKNCWYVDQHPFGHGDNLRLPSFDEAVEQRGYFQRAGTPSSTPRPRTWATIRRRSRS